MLEFDRSWKCKECGYYNPLDARRCRNCFMRRSRYYTYRCIAIIWVVACISAAAIILLWGCAAPVDDSRALNQYFLPIDNEDVGCTTDQECYDMCLDEGGTHEECEVEA